MMACTWSQRDEEGKEVEDGLILVSLTGCAVRGEGLLGTPGAGEMEGCRLVMCEQRDGRAGVAILITDWNRQSASDARQGLDLRAAAVSTSPLSSLFFNCFDRFSLNLNHEWESRLHRRN